MYNFDFNKISWKYPLLDTKDISFLNDFFNSSEIQLLLEEVEKIRKIKVKTFYLIFIFWIFIMISLILSWKFVIESLFWIWIFSFVIFCIIWWITLHLLYRKSKTLKNDLLPKFVSKINWDISYSQDSKYFTQSLDELRNIGLLKNYTRVNYIEDSIKYVIWENISGTLWENEKSILITWAEIKTEEKRTRHTKNWTQTYYVVTNHCYIMKVKFNNPRFILKNSIKLLEDVNDNIAKKFISVFVIEIFIVGAFLYLFSFINDSSLISNFINYLISNYLVFVVLLLWIFVCIWFVYSYIISNKRVKLENIEFEKEFDVYCDDQIESRKLLTPSFMYRLVDYVNKISRNRVYEMYFVNDYFFVKYNILKSHDSYKYMEFSITKSVFKNLEDYVKFYLEIKNIAWLVGDLKLFYYDKWMMNSEVIK